MSRASTVFCAILILASVRGESRAATPPGDRRNIETPNTNTHFKPRTYRTLAEWQARARHLLKQVLSAAGLMPMPPKTPLHPHIVGRIENKDYSIEKVYIEKLPGFYLAGNLYRPLAEVRHGSVDLDNFSAG